MDVADITIVGSGIASTITLVELFETILRDPGPSGKLAIKVIEKTDEFWKGIPYGNRSSVNALTITSVLDFIYEPERPAFFKWLKDTKDTWVTYYSANGGLTGERWLKNNLPLIEKEDWATIYVPRFLFGNYMREKLAVLITEVESKALVSLDLVQAEAVDVKIVAGGIHEVMLEYPGQKTATLLTHKLVIATGSAPVRRMCDIPGNKAIYINDIYEPSASENLERLKHALSKTADLAARNVLIIGSNASSIELLYLLEGLPELRSLISKTVIISPSGILPYHTSTESLKEHPLPNLDKLQAESDYNIQTLVDAAADDIKLALRDGANMDYVGTVIGNTLRLLDVLDESDKKAFYGIHAIRLRNMFRRSGPEYKNVAESLLDLQEVTNLKGKFLNTSATENGVLLNYLDTETGDLKTCPLTFKAIVNCSGSDDLDQSSSRLLCNMVSSHLGKMNLSGKGFEVNEKFEISPGLYIMGPLLGGNMNKLIHFWQLENAGRLMYLAPYLVKELLTT